MIKKILSPCVWYVGLIVLSLWIIGFGGFCLYALSLKFQTPEHTDGIVVLTGAGERIPVALNLLKQDSLTLLLISGVHPTVRPEELMQSVPTNLKNRVMLGYQARDTRGNARETQNWVLQNRIKSILLITSFYHMPRSLFETHRLNPDLTIIPFSIFPKSFNDSVDWIRTRYAWLLFLEYHKFMATHIQTWIERIYQ